MSTRRITWCLGCHTRGPWAAGRCPACTTSPHRAARKRALYSDPDYRATRLAIAKAIAAGARPACPYCGQPVGPTFDLDHTTGLQPAHQHCNRSAGAKSRASA